MVKREEKKQTFVLTPNRNATSQESSSKCNRCTSMLKKLKYSDMDVGKKYKLMSTDRKDKRKVVLAYNGKFLRLALPKQMETMKPSPFKNVYLTRCKTEED